MGLGLVLPFARRARESARFIYKASFIVLKNTIKAPGGDRFRQLPGSRGESEFWRQVCYNGRGGRMNTIILGVIAVVVIILAGVLVPLLVELRRTVASLRSTTEQQLNPALEELQATLKNMKGITANVNTITEEVKEFSGAIQQVGRKINIVNAAVDTAASSVTVRTLSLKAGIAAAVSYLIANLSRKGDRS
jgi:uncharacterized protein YoxC